MWIRSSKCLGGECVEVDMPEFRTASKCSGGACVEVHVPEFRTASRCDSGACVEVAAGPAEVLMRDSKDPHSPILAFEAGAWDEFVNGLKAGAFDR